MPTIGDVLRAGEERTPNDLIAESAQQTSLLHGMKPDLSLHAYLRAAWHTVHPDQDFVDNWHIRAMCEHVEAIFFGSFRNLVINVPPRTLKSITMIMATTWVWTWNPSHKFICGSFGENLSTEHNVLARRIIESPFYQDRYGDRFQLTTDQNRKTRFDNNRSGYRISTSVGSRITGRGADTEVVDDPISVRDAHRTKVMENTIAWFDQEMSTRFNDPKSGRTIVIMQRLHEKDLTGHVFGKFGDDYERLILPMRFDPERQRVTVLGFEDPRGKKGELLFPDRIPEVEVDRLERRLGPYMTSGQHQQAPSPPEGGLFKRQWFRVVQAIPTEGVVLCRFWDTAATDPDERSRKGKDPGDPDWTVGVKMARYPNGRFCIVHVIRVQVEGEHIHSLIVNTAKSDGRNVKVREEEEGGSSGKQVTSQRRQALPGYDYDGVRSTGAKTVRWQPMINFAFNGLIDMLAGEWNTEFLDELSNVPFAAHDDQADAAAGAYNVLSEGEERDVW